MLPDLRDDHTALAHSLLLSEPVAEGTTWHLRRIADLRNLLGRWVCDLPAIEASDAERAIHHRQAICDLVELIENLDSVGSTGPDDQLDRGRSSP